MERIKQEVLMNEIKFSMETKDQKRRQFARGKVKNERLYFRMRENYSFPGKSRFVKIDSL